MARLSRYRKSTDSSSADERVAFTLLELMVVFVLIAIIAGFAIPTYDRAVQRALERNAVNNLQTIKGAMKIYESKNGRYPDFDMGNYQVINSALSLNIVPDRVNYVHDALNGSDTNIVTATYSIAPWSLQFFNIANHVPIHCSSGSCPTCLNLGSGGCGN